MARRTAQGKQENDEKFAFERAEQVRVYVCVCLCMSIRDICLCMIYVYMYDDVIPYHNTLTMPLSSSFHDNGTHTLTHICLNRILHLGHSPPNIGHS